jgi:hypothetical protein
VLLPEELPQAADKAPAPVQRSLNIVILVSFLLSVHHSTSLLTASG